MESENKKAEGLEIDKKIGAIYEQTERLKEEKLVNLIIEIMVSLTLKQYYETSNSIPEVQPARTE